MIAKIVIQDNKFVGGFIRSQQEKDQDQLEITDYRAEWGKKWRATLSPDVLKCTSFNGKNYIEFEVRLNGMSRLTLNKGKGCQTIRMKREFTQQKNFDGHVYLIFNADGFRSAYYYSRDYLDFLEENGLVNFVNKDPNVIQFRDMKAADNAGKTLKIKDCSFYLCRKRNVMTDGDIVVENVADKTKKKANRVKIKDASWAIVEKPGKRGMNRVLISRENIFGIDLPECVKKHMEKRVSIGVPDDIDSFR